MNKKKRFSLQERVNHYNEVAISECKKNGKIVSNKEHYANGYVQGAERGFSLDFEKLNKFEKLGQIAGNNARMKSETIKF